MGAIVSMSSRVRQCSATAWRRSNEWVLRGTVPILVMIAMRLLRVRYAKAVHRSTWLGTPCLGTEHFEILLNGNVSSCFMPRS
jgi:hypothetical protein